MWLARPKIDVTKNTFLFYYVIGRLVLRGRWQLWSDFLHRHRSGNAVAVQPHHPVTRLLLLLRWGVCRWHQTDSRAFSRVQDQEFWLQGVERGSHGASPAQIPFPRWDDASCNNDTLILILLMIFPRIIHPAIIVYYYTNMGTIPNGY